MEQELDDNLNSKLVMLRRGDVTSNSDESEVQPSEKLHSDSMMGALRPALFMAHFFGILPVPSIDSEGKRKEFRWLSFKTIYAVIVLIAVIIEALLCIARLAVIGVSFQSSGNVVFFCNAVAAIYIFFCLAKSWKTLSQCWDCVERKVMGSFGWPNNLGRRMLIMTVLMLTLALVEFLMSLISFIGDAWLCSKDQAWTDILRKLFLAKFAMAFYVTSYAWWKGLIILILQFNVTFTWNFIDLFIILNSMAISARFKQLNDLILASNGEDRPVDFWRRTREVYFSLSELTRVTDRLLGTLVLLSFTGNLYFLCLQLMHSLSAKSRTAFHDVYFVFSLFLLVLRTFLVGMAGAAVFEESKKPKEVLYTVPSDSYCLEVERFLNHVCTDHVALTGRSFFSITRSLLLTIAGTVVTYEIILVQFKAGDSSDPDTINALSGGNNTILRQCIL